MTISEAVPGWKDRNEWEQQKLFEAWDGRRKLSYSDVVDILEPMPANAEAIRQARLDREANEFSQECPQAVI